MNQTNAFMAANASSFVKNTARSAQNDDFDYSFSYPDYGGENQIGAASVKHEFTAEAWAITSILLSLSRQSGVDCLENHK